MQADQVKRIVEAALLVADEPLSVERLLGLFTEAELAAAVEDAREVYSAAAEAPPDDETADSPRTVVRTALTAIERDAEGRGYELARIANGYRLQVRQELSPWVSRLFDERPPRYSRALLETLALIVYRQPITRGEVEDVRGVAVSASIMRTLLERGWIRAVGQRETPGRPTMYGTTRAFLSYFNLRSLSELPPLEEIKSLIEPALEQADADDEVPAPRMEEPSAGAAPERAAHEGPAPRMEEPSAGAAPEGAAREGPAPGTEEPEASPAPDDVAEPSNVVRLPAADDGDSSP